MNATENQDKKYAVEKYLEQVKILTALATTLLVSPNVIMTLRKPISDEEVKTFLKIVLFATNFFFLIAIILTYFIYSSVVGYADKGIYDIYRPATRLFSILQFAAILFGCLGLLIFFLKIIQ